MDEKLESSINQAWSEIDRTLLSREGFYASFFPFIEKAINFLDEGKYRVAEPDPANPNGWRINEGLQKAILLYFRLRENRLMRGHIPRTQYRDDPMSMMSSFLRQAAAAEGVFWDKVPLKCAGWMEADFRNAGFRVVPGAIIRKGAFIGPGAIVMANAFVNIGAYVGERTMIDAGARVGSCAQVGANVHLSGGAGIGGVLEPPQAQPTIIEDDCFIGANSEVAEGVVVKRGAVLSAGTVILGNTPIIDRTGNKVIRGYVPERAVVMMGQNPANHLNCPHIVKYRDQGTDAKVALNEALRG